MLQSMLVWVAVGVETIAFGGFLFGLCSLLALAHKILRLKPTVQSRVDRPIRMQPRLWA
jgi:hypothetical protein